MDRNTIIGILLIIAIVIGFSVYNAPSAEERAKQKQQRDSVLRANREKAFNDSILLAQKSAASEANKAVSSNDTLETNDSLNSNQFKDLYGVFSTAAMGEEKLITIDNELLQLTFSNKGGVIKSAKLKQFKNYHSKDTLSLFLSDLSTFYMPLSVQNRNIRTDSLYFDFVNTSSTQVSGENTATVTMRLYAGDDKKFIEYKYVIKGNEYMIDFSISMNQMEGVIDNASMVDLEWQSAAPHQEKSESRERENSSVYYRDISGDVSKLGFSNKEKEEIDYNLKWIGFSQQFFTQTIIAKNEFSHPITLQSEAGAEGSGLIKTFSASIRLPFEGKSNETFDMLMYLGPKDYKILKKYDVELEEQISLGWKIFRLVNTWFIINVFQFLDSYNISYGIIILILTILVKIILSPVTYKTYLSSAKMRILKPDIDAINEKNKDGDPLKKQQEVMALYRKAGVSPFAGCIPGLIQMPILFAIFNFFPSSIELRQQGFLWADDLSSYDSILQLPFNIPFYGDHVSLFTILMTITTMIYTSMTTTNMGSGAQAQQMKIMMYVMPILFLGVLNSNSAALSYYYFLANTISIAQTFIIRKFIIDEKKLHAQIEENKKRPESKIKKSKWQQRLEDMQKVQKARAEELQRKGRKK